jgi:TPR repeat protein
MERVKANDPAAMNQMGAIRFNEGDIDKAIEYLKEAAELGDKAAHYQLGCCITSGKVSRRTWKRQFTIGRRLLLEVIHKRDIILRL